MRCDRELEEFLHIGGVGVEGGGAAGRQPHHQQDLAGIFQQGADRGIPFAELLRRLEGIGLLQVLPHHRGDDGEAGTDDEGDAPAPGADLIVGQEHPLEQQQHDQRAQLAADERDVLEARIEAAVALVGHLGQVGGAGAVFPAEAQPLDDAGDAEHDRSRDADRRVGRGDRDHQRAEAHQHDRQHQRNAPAVLIGELPEQPAADRPHHESDRKQEGGIELLHHRIFVREERRGEIEGEGGIGEEVVPFDQITHRADEDRLDPPPHVDEIEPFAGRRSLSERLVDRRHGAAPLDVSSFRPSIAGFSRGDNSHRVELVRRWCRVMAAQPGEGQKRRALQIEITGTSPVMTVCIGCHRSSPPTPSSPGLSR